MTASPFKPEQWTDNTEAFGFEDITYHTSTSQDTVRVAINRPDCRNAFRPKTVDELLIALEDARVTPNVGCVLLQVTDLHQKMGAGPLAPVAINAFVEKMATNTKTPHQRP